MHCSQTFSETPGPRVLLRIEMVQFPTAARSIEALSYFNRWALASEAIYYYPLEIKPVFSFVKSLLTYNYVVLLYDL